MTLSFFGNPVQLVVDSAEERIEQDQFSRNVSNTPGLLHATKEPDMFRFCITERTYTDRTLTIREMGPEINSIPKWNEETPLLFGFLGQPEARSMKKLLATTGLALAVAVPAAAQDTATAKAEFVNMAGEKNGTATLTEAAQGVLIALEVTGLPAGEWVAFHVHETGKCDHQTGHDSAGGHFNPTNAEHGYLTAKGPHAGDMPNQRVGADGVLRAQAFNSMVKLDGGETAIRGKALMIHGGQDDYKSQPAGDAGKRQACAVTE